VNILIVPNSLIEKKLENKPLKLNAKKLKQKQEDLDPEKDPNLVQKSPLKNPRNNFKTSPFIFTFQNILFYIF
jgi:hypothetical protein